MCQFIESIKIDHGKAFALAMHNDRMNRTRQHFWKGCKELDLYACLNSLPEEGLYKCRVVYGEQITLVEYVPYTLRKVETLKLVCCDDIDYRYKSTDRSQLQTAFEQRADADDVLIVKNGLLTDTSIGNIALYDGKEWITPQTPLLEGVHRRKLLQQGAIKERSIAKEEVMNYQKIRIFNALIDFGAIEITINEQSLLF